MPTKTEKRIDSIEDLNSHLHRQEDRIEQLEQNAKLDTSRAELDQIRQNMNALKVRWKSDAVSTPSQPGNIEVINRSLGAIFCKEGGKHRDDVEKEIDGMTGKALVGSPLVIDATTGSYTIPETYRSDIAALLTETSELRPLVTNVAITSNSMKYPSKLAGVSFTRVSSDSTALTEASPTFSEIDLDVETFALWISVTENFLDDNLVVVGDYFRRIIQEAYVESFDKSMLNNAANPTGLLQNGSVNTVTMSAGRTGFSDLDITDLYSMVEALTTGVKRRNAAFFMHPIVWDICRLLTDANGNALVTPWREAMGRELFGYKVILSDEMPSTSAADTPFIAFGSPKQLLYGDRLGVEIKYFGDTVQAATYQEVFFRARYRAAYATKIASAFSILKTAAA